MSTDGDKIILKQVGPSFGLPSASPFCLRLEAFLRLAALDYDVDNTPDPRKAPKGKVPWIVDGGRELADTHFILEHLTRTRGLTVDVRLSAEQRAVAHACTRMLTENFYWVIVHSRWIYPDSWAPFRRDFLRLMPPVIGPLLVPMIRRGMRKAMHQHGMGRHSHDEIAAIARGDIEALDALLGARDYFFSAGPDDGPTSFDATVYAFIASLLVPPFDTPQRRVLIEHARLTAHAARVHARLFPELPLPPVTR
ncbi:MAG: glutathione S-transferase family protein [Myxococcales bacterium]|nr:glutathione S-transferase family protein [Myxococcales bacterium]MCB9756404.1 glutathione S-transferase family protein [Myxococcales bacterium]